MAYLLIKEKCLFDEKGRESVECQTRWRKELRKIHEKCLCVLEMV